MHKTIKMKKIIEKKTLETKIDILSNELCSCCSDFNVFIEKSKTNEHNGNKLPEKFIFFADETVKGNFAKKSDHLKVIHTYHDNHFSSHFLYCLACYHVFHIVNNDEYVSDFSEEGIIRINLITKDSPSYEMALEHAISYNLLLSWKEELFSGEEEIILYRGKEFNTHWDFSKRGIADDTVEALIIKASDVSISIFSTEYFYEGYIPSYKLTFPIEKVLNRFYMNNNDFDPDYNFDPLQVIRKSLNVSV